LDRKKWKVYADQTLFSGLKWVRGGDGKLRGGIRENLDGSSVLAFYESYQRGFSMGIKKTNLTGGGVRIGGKKGEGREGL